MLYILLLMALFPSSNDSSKEGIITNYNPISDSLALVELYNNTNGENWSISWDLEEPMNTWYGVELSNSRCVISLNLSSNQLSGNLPDLNLPDLRNLNLSFNEISGPLPSFSNLPNLRFFSSARNQISGSIPDLNLPNLINFILNENQITGILPDFTGMPLLEWLDLKENQLTGVIPDFSNLDSLRIIDLSLNLLEGNIPDFSSLQQLESLNLQVNGLSGEIPIFSNLPDVETINLHINSLSGEIPNFELPSLTTLNISANNLTGKVPVFDLCPVLRNIRVNSNELNELSDFSSLGQGLFALRAHRNQFTFKDILPNININVSNFTYEEQDSIFETTNINLIVGKNYTIDLEIDPGLTENVYEWYKDGEVISTIQGDNKLELANVQLSDEGIYSCRITNPQAPLLILNSRLIILNISDPNQLAFNSLLIDGECTMDSSGMIEISVTNGIPPFQYQWSNGQSSNIIENLSDGLYSVTITDGNNQTQTQTFEINVNELLIPAQTTSDQFVCQDETTLFANLPEETQGMWSTTSTANIIEPNNPLSPISQLENTNNLVWTLSTANCPDYDKSTLSISIPFAPKLNDDFFSEVIDRDRIFDLLDNDDLFSAQNEPTVVFFDIPSNIELENLSPGKFKVRPLEENLSSLEFRYRVCLLDCPDRCDNASVFINYKQNIPSAITPNGDGLNDFFVIPFLENSANSSLPSQLIIFNRWGNIILQQSPYMNNWNGTNKDGNPLPEGTYYFVLNFNNGNPASIQGDITILR